MGIWKQSLFVGSFAACSLSVGSGASAGLMVTSVGSSERIDFGQFRGDGFAPNPSTTQLDSDHWRIEGLSDGAGSFGGTHLSGDFARGQSSGGVSSGGVYGFQVDSVSDSNWALGFQPTASDLTPGTATLMITNATGMMVDQLDLGYQIWIRNDGDRSGSLQFNYSLDDSSYETTNVGPLTSVGPADPIPLWVSTDQVLTLSGLRLENGSSLFLQWQLEDVAGSGSRDEWALDNVDVRLTSKMNTVPEPSSWMVLGMLSPFVLGSRGRFRCARRFKANQARAATRSATWAGTAPARRQAC
jgi:hypothetical protein